MGSGSFMIWQTRMETREVEWSGVESKMRKFMRLQTSSNEI